MSPTTPERILFCLVGERIFCVPANKDSRDIHLISLSKLEVLKKLFQTATCNTDRISGVYMSLFWAWHYFTGGRPPSI